MSILLTDNNGLRHVLVTFNTLPYCKQPRNECVQLQFTHIIQLPYAEPYTQLTDLCSMNRSLNRELRVADFCIESHYYRYNRIRLLMRMIQS